MPLGLQGGGGDKGQHDKKPLPRSQVEDHPKRLIFAPGDIKASGLKSGTGTVESISGQATPTANENALSSAARAHQFTVNPPLTIADFHATNPLHQFNTWFRDDRVAPAEAPETATLATANIETGRVSARVVYLKELDERGWVIYSNWGSVHGKGSEVFGTTDDGESGFVKESAGEESNAKGGNRWAALTFFWPTIERQVRIEGIMEALTREESMMYWQTRERNSKLGAWASQQSKILWTAQGELLSTIRDAAVEEGGEIDDGRQTLEKRVSETSNKFTKADIPLPPFWGGARLVPESVEFWQGRRSRLHDRFRAIDALDDCGADSVSSRLLLKNFISRAAVKGLGLTAACQKPNLIPSAGAHIKHVQLEVMGDPPKARDPNHISNFQWNKVVNSDLETSDHCLYWDSPAPTKDQLAWADEFFRSEEHTSKRLVPSRAYHQLEKPKVPEIVFMSASNGEKRLTLNWIFEQYLSTANAVPGRKFKLVPYAIGCTDYHQYKAIIVDTPGLASKNSEERAQMFARYLINRRSPYVFLTVNAEHGPKMQDIECLGRLRRFGIPHQVILNRADHVLKGSWERKVVRQNRPYCEEGFQNLSKRLLQMKELVQPKDMEPGQLPGKGEIIAYAGVADGAFGISHLRWAILQAAQLTDAYDQEVAKGIRRPA
ncbi:hypothetical protein KEM54_000347 [Ascosphaera aggregata]|nr:hypothetical protein KEM54_000347 [Ascosphaera aggregata]